MAKSRKGWLTNLLDGLFGDLFSSAIVHKHSRVTINYGTGPSVQGAGGVETELRPVAPFDRVRSSLMADVVVRVGHSVRVQVEAQTNLLEHIVTEVRDGELVLEMQTGSYTSVRPMRVEVDLPNLTALHLSGHGDVDVAGVDTVYFRLHHSGMGDVEIQGTARTLDLDLSGHGNVRIDGVSADDLTLRHTGMGDVRIAGATEKMALNGSGHGNLDLVDLVARDVEMTHSGMGDLDLHANGNVLGFASGHGDITVRGRASWRVRHTGMGDVSFR